MKKYIEKKGEGGGVETALEISIVIIPAIISFENLSYKDTNTKITTVESARGQEIVKIFKFLANNTLSCFKEGTVIICVIR